MEENPSSTTLIDISRYCSSFPDGDIWSSSQSSCSRSPVQRLFSPTPTRSSDSDSPVLPSLPLPPSTWSLTASFAHIDLDSPLPSLWPTTTMISTEQQSTPSQNHFPACCQCHNSTEQWTEKLPANHVRSRPRSIKEDKSPLIPSPIQRPSPSLARRNPNSAAFSSLKLVDHLSGNEKRKSNSMIDREEDHDEDDDDDGTLRLHVSNIPFTWSKEKLADVFGKYGTTFDVEVVYNERGSKGFGFVTFLAKTDALEAKRRMDREIVDGRRLVVNFAKPKQKTSGSSKDRQQLSLNSFKTHPTAWKTNSSSERSQRVNGNSYQSLGFSTPPTARRQHLSGFSSLSSTPTRSTTTHNYQRYYL